MPRRTRRPTNCKISKIQESIPVVKSEIPLDKNDDLDLDFAIEDLNLHEDKVYMKMRPLERRFIYYLYVQEAKSWTNSKTYKIAYRKKDDFPNQQASLRYWELMQKKHIQHCRKIVMKHIQRKYDKIPQRVIQEECSIAFADIAKFFDAEGHLLVHPSRLPAKVRAAIASLKSTHLKNGNVVYEVSLWNKGASLARLESIFGMNSADKLEVSGPGGGPIKSANLNLNYDVSLLSYEDKRTLMELLEKCKVVN